MRNKIIFLSILSIIINISFFIYLSYPYLKKSMINPLGRQIPIPSIKPLEKYSFENLKKTDGLGSEMEIGNILKEDNNFISYMFYFMTEGKKVSGLANIPVKTGNYPVIVMIRGFVPLESFTTGEGTRRTAEEFVKNGFITLAPDFLGFGESASPSAQPMEERFETYTSTTSLLSSVENLNKAILNKNIAGIVADTDKIGLWGHSNGGHIALATLEITGKNYPTVLWAPVSIFFPYSILYYTDEYDDHGKALRKLVAEFEDDYDAEKYTLTNYLDLVNAPIQLHQGGMDESVPRKWSDNLYQQLKKMDKDITYFPYPSENHNFTAGDWTTAVARSIAFYRKYFKEP